MGSHMGSRMKKGFVGLYVEVPAETMREINQRMKVGLTKWEVIKFAVMNSIRPIGGAGAKGGDRIPINFMQTFGAPRFITPKKRKVNK